jgi:hypothetical protein
MKKYIIVREDYYDEIGITKKTNFCIKESKKFLFFKWWSYVKYKESYESGSYKSVLNFKNLYDAEKFVNEVLIKNGPREKWSSIKLKEIEKK